MIAEHRRLAFRILTIAVSVASVDAAETPAQVDDLVPEVRDGYRGIWYMNGPMDSEYRYKYSGGFATYPQWHMPIAIHVASERKTFFVLGGSAGTIGVRTDQLEHLISYYDHDTGTVPRPVRILLKRTSDAHDNPVLAIDGEGYMYVFSNAHGARPTSYIHRSRKPYDISDWEVVDSTNFSYGQPWYLPESRQLLFLHTLYEAGRTLNWKTSPDGRTWSEPQMLAYIERGNYQLSARFGDTDRVVTVFDMHPDHGRSGGGTGLNYRTNMYYIETRDAGRSWTTVDGTAVTLPLRDANNAALIRDYRSEDLNVYLKSIAFTGRGHPVILYLTSKSWVPGPASGPFQWHTARWTGSDWEIRSMTASDHNYDHGELYIESDGLWRVIAPTSPGPQAGGTGGEMVSWISRDEGRSWEVAHRLTENSRYNHHYARKPVGAHPDVYAIWADGSPLGPTSSSIYFATKDGKVFRLPEYMTAPTAKPTRLR